MPAPNAEQWKEIADFIVAKRADGVKIDIDEGGAIWMGGYDELPLCCLHPMAFLDMIRGVKATSILPDAEFPKSMLLLTAAQADELITVETIRTLAAQLTGVVRKS